MVNPRYRMYKTRTQSTSNEGVKKAGLTVTRRSARIHNSTVQVIGRKSDLIAEPIYIYESEEDEELYADGSEDEEEIHANDGPSSSILDGIAQKQETCQVVKSSKGMSGMIPTENNVSNVDLSYKRLYFESQKKNEILTKKNETLTKKNQELSKDLEVATAKIEAFEESSHVYSALLSKLQDVTLLVHCGQRTQSELHTTSQMVTCPSIPADVADVRGADGPGAVVKKRGRPKMSRPSAFADSAGVHGVAGPKNVVKRRGRATMAHSSDPAVIADIREVAATKAAGKKRGRPTKKLFA